MQFKIYFKKKVKMHIYVMVQTVNWRSNGLKQHLKMLQTRCNKTFLICSEIKHCRDDLSWKYTKHTER